MILVQVSTTLGKEAQGRTSKGCLVPEDRRCSIGKGVGFEEPAQAHSQQLPKTPCIVLI